MDREPETLQSSASFQEVVDRVLQSEHTEFFVVDGEGRLEGSFQLRTFTRMLVEGDALMSVVVARDLAETNAFSIGEDDNLEFVMRLFSSGPHEEIPVVPADSPRRIVGSVHKKDVIHAYNREVLRRDLAGSVSSTVLAANRGQQVELGGGYVLQDLQPPARFVGRSIRELDIQATTGVHVVLIRTRGNESKGGAIRVPTPDDRIAEGDRLVVSGTRAAVEPLDRP